MCFMMKYSNLDQFKQNLQKIMLDNSAMNNRAKFCQKISKIDGVINCATFAADYQFPVL